MCVFGCFFVWSRRAFCLAVCDVQFVRSCNFRDAPASSSPRSMASSPCLAFSCDETSQCPICQEPLFDQSIKEGNEKRSVVTTLCSHSFHSTCLSESPCSVCAVCRFNYEPSSRTKCFVCGSDDDLWMCTQCGHTGCGRENGSHAVQHFRDNPDHNIASNIGTQRVWDYKADNWVFDPLCFPMAAEGLNGFASQEEADEAFARQVGGKSLQQMSLNSKLEAIGTEYNYVLVSMLESQKQ